MKQRDCLGDFAFRPCDYFEEITRFFVGNPPMPARMDGFPLSLPQLPVFIVLGRRQPSPRQWIAIAIRGEIDPTPRASPWRYLSVQVWRLHLDQRCLGKVSSDVFSSEPKVSGQDSYPNDQYDFAEVLSDSGVGDGLHIYGLI